MHGASVSGWGVMSIEHIIPQSSEPAERNMYSNCVYCCRRCNLARSNKPLEDGGAVLLDPTVHAWAQHFHASGDHLRPREGDKDAEYTHHAYDIDAPEKLALRELRRTTIQDHLKFLRRSPSRITLLFEHAEKWKERDPHASVELIQAAKLLRDRVLNAIRDLSRYAAIPVDAAAACRCEPAVALSLPPTLRVQLIELPSIQLAGVE